MAESARVTNARKGIATAVVAKEAITIVLTAPDYFALLGVKRDADGKALKQAYRRRALRVHPDKCNLKGEGIRFAEEAFKKVSQAYACLSDPAARKRHEQHTDSRQEEKAFTYADAQQMFTELFGEMMRREDTATSASLPPLVPKMSSGKLWWCPAGAAEKRQLASVCAKLAHGKKAGEIWDDAMERVSREEKAALLTIFDNIQHGLAQQKSNQRGGDRARVGQLLKKQSKKHRQNQGQVNQSKDVRLLPRIV